jgi:hypothetical protein
MAGTKTSTTSAERQHAGSVTTPKKLDLTVHPKPLDATKPDPVLDAVDRTKAPGILEQLSQALGQSSGEQFIPSEPIIGETPKDKPSPKDFTTTTAGIGFNGDGKGYVHITGGNLTDGFGGGARLTEDGKLQGTYVKGKAAGQFDIYDLSRDDKEDSGFEDVYGGQFDEQKDAPASGATGSNDEGSSGGDAGGFDRPTEARDRPGGGTPPKQSGSGDGGGSTGGGGGDAGGAGSSGGSGGSGSTGNGSAGSSGASGSNESNGSNGSNGAGGAGESGGGQESKESEEKTETGGNTETPDPGGPEMVDPDVVFPYGGPRPKSDPGPDQEPSIDVEFQPEWWKGTEMERHDESWLQSNLDLPRQIVSNPDPNGDPTGATPAKARPIPADPVEGTTHDEVNARGEAILGRDVHRGIRPEVSRPADDNPTPAEEQPTFPNRKPLPV